MDASIANRFCSQRLDAAHQFHLRNLLSLIKHDLNLELVSSEFLQGQIKFKDELQESIKSFSIRTWEQTGPRIEPR